GVLLSARACTIVLDVACAAVGVLLRHGKPVAPQVHELLDKLKAVLAQTIVMSSGRHDASRARVEGSLSSLSRLAAEAGCSLRTVQRASKGGELPAPGLPDRIAATWITSRRSQR